MLNNPARQPWLGVAEDNVVALIRRQAPEQVADLGADCQNFQPLTGEG
jgi:hypothetical protein